MIMKTIMNKNQLLLKFTFSIFFLLTIISCEKDESIESTSEATSAGSSERVESKATSTPLVDEVSFVNTSTMNETNFDNGSLSPFYVRNTSGGNTAQVISQRAKFHWKQANYNGLNSGEKSLAYVEYNSRYGLDLPYTNQQLLLFQTESMYIASRLLRDGGYLLLKSKQGDIGLSNLVCEASIGTNLERMGEINFLTECSSSSDMLTCAVDGSAVTQLIVFRKVGKPTRSLGSFYHQSYPTLSAKVGTLKKQARLDYIDQGLSKRRSNNLMKTCVAKLWDYCCECQNKKKSGDDRLNPNHIFGTLGKQLYHMSSRKLTWNSDKFDWKNTVEHSTLSLGRLQVHVMNESMNSCIVANMATILFSRVLKIHEVNRDLSIENEMKNNYKERRDCLAAAGIVGEDAHQLFLNSTVARMIVNAKHLRLRYE